MLEEIPSKMSVMFYITFFCIEKKKIRGCKKVRQSSGDLREVHPFQIRYESSDTFYS